MLEHPPVGNPSKVTVFGLGFVGLPLALSFWLAGSQVDGVDANAELVAAITRGETGHAEAFEGRSIQEILADAVESNRFRAVTDAALALSDTQDIVVTVGVRHDGHRLDFSAIETVTETIARHAPSGSLVLFRPTVPPRTMGDRVLPLLRRHGRTPGVDILVAYAPERIAEGRAFGEFRTMPTVVAGVNPESVQAASTLIRRISTAEIVHASSFAAAELTKVVENVQRDVNLAVVQELARFCEAADLDVFELVRLANTHPRVHLLTPGPGVGGYCIPQALSYLRASAQPLNLYLPLLELARELNDGLPRIITDMVSAALISIGTTLSHATVAIFGLAMKDYSNDIRYSPPLDIVAELQRSGANVRAYDPAVPQTLPFLVQRPEECLNQADVLLILARQTEIDRLDAATCLRWMKTPMAVVDTRNWFPPEVARSAGATLRRI